MRSITMTRVLLSGALALWALGAIGGFTPGVATAEAASSVSPFAGTYVWGDWSPPITIADGGQIRASDGHVSIDGRVRADGSYSFTLTLTETGDYRPHGRVPREEIITHRYKHAGTMAPDANGDMIGTADTGDSFVWLRQ